MIEILNNALYYIYSLPFEQDFFHWMLFFFPLVILVELPFYILILTSVIKWVVRKPFQINRHHYSPTITCAVTAYKEGKQICHTVLSLLEQIYPGHIEIIIIIDNGISKTTNAALECIKLAEKYNKRTIKVVPKSVRGGHPSSMNLALKLAKGDILFVLDADCCCDNTMVNKAVLCFQDTNVVALSGSLRPFSHSNNFLTRLQIVEYTLGIQFARTGLGELNVINNVSGAMGIFRTDFIRKIGGWSNCTGEDLDLTLKMMNYFKRYPELKIICEPKSSLLTEVPDTIKGLVKQRLRWDGDMLYVYLRRHWRSFTSSLLGWRALIIMIWYALFFQLLMPITLIIYLCILLFAYPMGFTLAIVFYTYCYYLFITVLFFMLHLLTTSNRIKEDILLIPYLFIMPIYAFFMRLGSGLYLIVELLFKTHKDSSMLPWRIAKKATKKK